MSSNGVAAKHSPKSVCVIGAGAAGLCALRHFTALPEQFYPVICYEQTDKIGGLWNYTDEVGVDRNGFPVHTSMYRDMRTNAPVEISDFPDFKFQVSRSYTPHSEMLKYLHLYAEHWNILPYIQFGQQLKHLTRVEEIWKIEVYDIPNKKTQNQQFDIVLICTSYFQKPIFAKLNNVDKFEGSVIHSHDYRFREPYTGQRVAVIGAGPSGVDIAAELSTVAKEVIFVNRTKTQFKIIQTKVHQLKAEVQDFGKHSITLKMAESEEILTIEIDSLIIATGYLFSVDFIDLESCGLIQNVNGTVEGIYRNFINIKHPSMALLNIERPIISFPMYHLQVQYFIKLLLGQIPTPTPEEMNQDTQKDLLMRQSFGYSPSARHYFDCNLSRIYFAQIANDGQLEPVKPVVLNLLETIFEVRKIDPVKFREKNYRLINDEQFEEIL